jgi:hypothetical protein
MLKYFANIDRLERLSWSAMGAERYTCASLYVYDYGTYMIAPHPHNKQLVEHFENELANKRILCKHRYIIKRSDFDDINNWTT